jgi:uncharacterized ubiquitin-like protein YukD
VYLRVAVARTVKKTITEATTAQSIQCKCMEGSPISA